MWSEWFIDQRIESAVRRLLAATEQCQDQLENTRRGALISQQGTPPAAHSRMI
jgi:hypothetical protein